MMEIRTVLCPVDLSPLCERVVELGIQIARRFDARLVLHHNLDTAPSNVLAVSWMWSEEHEPDVEKREAEAERRLKELLDRASGAVAAEARMSRGPIDAVLLTLAAELPADLVVMGTHGCSTAEHRSLTESLIAQAPCPVLTLRDEGIDTGLFAPHAEPPKRRFEVLVPMDFEKHSLAAAEVAFELAAGLPLHLTLLHAEPPARHPHPKGEPDAKEARRMAAAERRLAELVPEELRDRVDCHVPLGKPVEMILAEAESLAPDLIVMGAHSKGLLHKVMAGSPSKEILHRSGCPVLYVSAESAKRRRAAARRRAAG